MKKTSRPKGSKRGEIRQKYWFDYRKSRPNRFAPLMKDRYRLGISIIGIGQFLATIGYRRIAKHAKAN